MGVKAQRYLKMDTPSCKPGVDVGVGMATKRMEVALGGEGEGVSSATV